MSIPAPLFPVTKPINALTLSTMIVTWWMMNTPVERATIHEFFIGNDYRIANTQFSPEMVEELFDNALTIAKFTAHTFNVKIPKGVVH